jgi:predicted MFS family arabinose efflux permease
MSFEDHTPAAGRLSSPSPQQAIKSRRSRWAAAVPLAWASSVVAIGVIPSFMTGALAIQMRSEFEVTPVVLGVLVGLFFGSAALASGPAGRLVQRLGSWSGMEVAAVGSAICLGGIALVAHDAATLGLLLIIGGLANSFANPGANLLLVDVVPADRRALALGVKQAAIPMATLLAGLSIPVLALTLGWRWAFGVAACAALAIAAFGSTRREPRASRPPTDDASHQSEAAASVTARVDLLLLAAAAMLGIWGGQAMGTFLVSYTVGLGESPTTAGLILTVASIAGISARIVGGWVVDRRGTGGIGELKAMLMIGSVGISLIAIGLPPLMWLGPILAFAGGWGWSGIMTYVAVRVDPSSPASATGITQAGVFLGATIGVPLFGVIVEASSYTAAWGATVLTMLLALMLVQIVGRRSPLGRGPAA